MIDTKLNKRMKTLLKERKLHQKELAARLGMDYQKVTRVMNGRAPVYAHELPRYAEALGVSLEAILGLERP